MGDLVYEAPNASNKAVGSGSLQPSIFLRLLGGFRLSVNNEDVPVSSEFSRTLLSFLALHAGTAHTRDALIGKFWPDLSEQQGRRRLSQTLWKIRRSLEPAGFNPIVATSGTVQFTAGEQCVVDSVDFMHRTAEIGAALLVNTRAVPVTVLEEVAQLYRGPLLDGHYDDWIFPERDRLVHAWLDLLGWLVQSRRLIGDLDGALRWARQRVLVDPLREHSHREVIRLCLLLERPVEARRQLAACTRILQTELGLDPTEETLALVAELGPGGGSSRHRVQLETTMVGRNDERAVLLHKLERCEAGEGGICLVAGDSGSGKSKLLQDLADRAGFRGATVMWAECAERTINRPYAGLVPALAESLRGIRGEHVVEMVEPLWVEAAAKVIPELMDDVVSPMRQALEPDEERWRQDEALARLVLTGGRVSPTLVFIEDLQWSDLSTLSVLKSLASRLHEAGVLLCISYRKLEAKRRPEVWELLTGLEVVDGAVALALGPLSVEAVAELAVAVASWAPGEAAIKRLRDETDGNPYFIVETLRAWPDYEVAAVNGVKPRFPLVSTVADVLSRRFSQLTIPTQDLLKVMAVAVRPLRTAEISEVAGVASARVRLLLGEAIDAALVEDLGRHYVIRHQQVREAIRATVEPLAAVALHGKVVDLLTGELCGNPSWDEVGDHAFAAELWDAAADAFWLAAREATEVFATVAAVSHLDRAIDSVSRLPTEDVADRRNTSVEMLLLLENQLDVLGERARQGEALAQLDQLLSAPASRPSWTQRTLGEIGRRRVLLLANQSEFKAATTELLNGQGSEDLADDPQRQALLGTILNWAGDAADAVPVLEEAVVRLQAAGLAVGPALRTLGSALTEVQEFDGAVRHLKRALAEAEAANDVRGQIDAHGYLANAFTQQGQVSEAEADYSTALKMASEIGYRRAEGVNLVNLGLLYALSGRGSRALARYDDAEKVFESMGHQRGLAFVRFNRADVRCSLLGDVDSAEKDAKAAVEFFWTVGDRRHESYAFDVLANVSRLRGRVTACRRHVERAQRRALATGDRFLEVQATRTLAHLELGLGRPAELLAAVQSALSICKELSLDSQIPALRALEAQGLLQLGQTEEALDVAKRAAQLVEGRTALPHLALWWCAEVVRECQGVEPSGPLVQRAWDALERAVDGLDSEQRTLALSRVPENKAITKAQERLAPSLVKLRLPDISAPTGRPLRPDEFVAVRWTVTAPADFVATTKVERRRAQLLRLTTEAADQGAAPRIDDLAGVLDASRATVKRDLAYLRGLGYQPATRGSIV